MSTATTGWPISAKQAALTRPTQPTPMTPIAGLSLAFTMRKLLLFVFAQRGRDREHLALVERLQQGVVDPVGALVRLEADQPQAVAVVEELVLPAVDRPRLAGVRQDRRVDPVR